MMKVFHPEFRDEYQQSNYPFGDACSLLSTGGKSLGQSTFVDASIHPLGVQNAVYLSSVVISGNIAYFYLSEVDNAVVAYGSTNVLTPDNVINLLDAYGRPAGVLVGTSTSLAVFQTWDIGTYEFESDATEFIPSTVLPMPDIGVRSILTEDDDVFLGDVWLVGKDGVVLREDNGAIRVDIVRVPRKLRGKALRKDDQQHSA
jgi:hypothetical protein